MSTKVKIVRKNAEAPKQIKVKAPKTEPKSEPEKTEVPAQAPALTDREIEALSAKLGVTADSIRSVNPAHLASAISGKGALPKARTIPEGGHGSLYVRMLNGHGQVTPVVASYVPERLYDGFRFIEREPTVPRYLGNPSETDVPGRPIPRMCPQPHNVDEAALMWGEMMENDRIEFGHRDDLEWSFLTTDFVYIRDRNKRKAN